MKRSFYSGLTTPRMTCRLFTSGSSVPSSMQFFFLGVANIIKNIAGDTLTGREDRDARRIAHDKLCADASDRLLERHGLLVRVERLLRAGNHLRRDVLLPHERRLVALVAAANVRESGYQTFEVAFTVAHRNIGEQIAEIAELGLNIVKSRAECRTPRCPPDQHPACLPPAWSCRSRIRCRR